MIVKNTEDYIDFMLKELFKGSVIYGVAPFLPKILTVAILPILTKYLTSTDFGIIGTITAITFAVQALQDLGLRVLLPNYFYKSPVHYKAIWREIYGFLSIWMLLFALIQAVLLYFFIPSEAEDNRWLIIGLSNFSTVLFGPTALIGQTYYQLNLKPSPVAIRIVLAGIITIMSNFICVVVFKLGYLGAYVGSFAGTFLMNLSYWPVVNRRIGLSPIYCFKRRTIRRLLMVGLPTIPHYYTSYLMNSSNVVAMNYYRMPQSVIGHLTMSQQISNVFETVLNAVNQMFSPLAYKQIKEKNVSDMKKILLSYILMAFTMTFLYSLWAREAYSILIKNEEIAATYKYSIVLVMALNYRPLYVYCCNYFFYHEHTVQLLGISLVSGIISCVLYFSLMPFMGINAALIGFYLGCLYYGYSGYLFRFYKEHTIYKLKWYLFPLIQIFLTMIAYFAVDYSIVVKLIISLIFIVIVVLFFFGRVEQSRYIIRNWK